MSRNVHEDSDSDIAGRLGVILLTSTTSSESGNRHASLMDQWNDYFQEGTLQDFQRLCADLGLPNNLPSKTKCRDALRSINVNIKQFLECKNKPDGVKLFKSQRALIRWTLKKKAIFPKRNLPKGSPLQTLLKQIFD
ncbi:hypothetical protein FBEOM_12029 [Fusarium beomiforme]|uniref:Uncharacterized protein n=1 Tax=Fusarium beomiforme TaxID=44412 RepID=A0A9P5A8A4_9HYPO|nr:hypothetical protein FBEOM_12029 [Fusarium beomiforme]